MDLFVVYIEDQKGILRLQKTSSILFNIRHTGLLSFALLLQFITQLDPHRSILLMRFDTLLSLF